MSVCVLCGQPWVPGFKSRCECGGFCSWGIAKGAPPDSWDVLSDGSWRPKLPTWVCPSCEVNPAVTSHAEHCQWVRDANLENRSLAMREDGYYFVQWAANSNWTMGYWAGSVWYVMGESREFSDSDFSAFKRLPIQSESEVK